jgi:hypothetical protein
MDDEPLLRNVLSLLLPFPFFHTFEPFFVPIDKLLPSSLSWLFVPQLLSQSLSRARCVFIRSTFGRVTPCANKKQVRERLDMGRHTRVVR